MGGAGGSKRCSSLWGVGKVVGRSVGRNTGKRLSPRRVEGKDGEGGESGRKRCLTL
jgi:hypothetical protein